MRWRWSELVEVDNLTKSYGKMRGITDLNFKVEKGEVIGFLGPNGAGKSTTMNIITGVIPPTKGTVKVCGYDIKENSKEAKKHLGYLPEQPPVCMSMTINEYLSFISELKLVDKKISKNQIDEIMELVKIADVRGRLIRNLSKGYRQRVGLAQALVGNPEVLILDEPTVGLDPMQMIEIRKLIKLLGREHTVILSSHILSEVNAVCDRVIIINKGKLVAADTPENLERGYKKASQFSVTVSGPKDEVLKHFHEISGVNHVEISGEEDGKITYIIEIEKEMDVIRPINLVMATAGYTVSELKSIDLSLEDVFLQLVVGEKEG